MTSIHPASQESDKTSTTYLIEMRSHKILVDRVVGIPGETVGLASRLPRAAVVPVVAANDDELLADIVSLEAPVVEVEGPVKVHDLVEMASNLAVVADLVASVAANIAAETTETGVPLLEDYCLHLNFADGLSDNPV